ncbi:MAG: 23S rRNA (uracil(1939)-C(5))-methyltransferase RlmD [Lachnospiraceae bacterium]|nr:23S rRNA (uracil(1939)-C(5))-methyltransferase RlmD [Lachnospiraceae bacterium]
MKKGQIFEGTIEQVIFPNKGIVKAEERDVVVKNGVAGQKVKFMVQKVRKGKCEGQILEILQKADDEIEPQCPHFGICGGCTYQNLRYEDQLQMKAQQVKALMDGVCDSYEFEGIKGSPREFAYRNKMEFSFGDEYKDGPLALGMHKRGSFYDIVTVDHCRIVEEDFGKILRCVLEEARKLNLPYFHKLSHQGYFRHLLVRRGVKSGEILVDLVTSTQASPDLTAMKEALLSLKLDGTIKGILHTENDSLADVIQNDRTEILYGQDHFDEELLGLKFKISPFSFFQTNSLGAEVLYEKAREYVGTTKDKVIFDLYSGTGTIAQMLAPVAKKVIGVEIVEEAVEAAKENAKRNGLGNCEFIAGDVLKVIDEIEEKPDLIVLDPPRDGIHPKALEKIIAYQVEHMVYISCKPTSLARDLEVLQARGYEVKKICCVDLFPSTVHVETVVLLGRKMVNDKSIEYMHVDYEPKDAEYLKGIKGSATYAEIKAWIKKQYNVSVSSLYIAQCKSMCGFEKRDNYNKGAEGHKVPNCPAEKRELIMKAFEHFKMI